ncbi:MAG: amino acid/polyamine/organocation transporter, superfamily, partial [Marmoricola sp.]|nr:amino acid/polyamine/organocation transporter, superfamily [Marmoricola sp.]
MATTEPKLNADDELLAKLGYKQELSRSWSSFSNFAISFSIISILAGCFTTFGQAWNNGGPIAISWGWPIISGFILIIGFTMSELVSAYPTSGGIYWWAAKMGGPAAGFFTGWLNLIGLLAVTASVAYGAATFVDLTLSTVSQGWADGYGLGRIYVIFLIILVIAAGLNVFGGHLMA